MQTIIYLIRHAEVYNPEEIIYGRLPNYGLSAKGEKEVEKTAEFLRDKQIEALYASPLLRAQQSAEIIREKLHLPTVTPSEEITEVLTAYQGRPFKDLDLLQSEVYLKPLSPTDETVEQLAKRMMEFIKQCIKQHPGGHIALVSHGDPIMAVKAAIKRNSFEFYQFKTDHYIHHAEVYKITQNDQNKLTIASVFKPVV